MGMATLIFAAIVSLAVQSSVMADVEDEGLGLPPIETDDDVDDSLDIPPICFHKPSLPICQPPGQGDGPQPSPAPFPCDLQASGCPWWKL